MRTLRLSPLLLASLDLASQSLSLPLAAKDSKFFDQGLVHNNATAGEPVPRACRKIWDALEKQVIRA